MTFEVLDSRDGIQTAVMRLQKAEESGPFGNEHAQSAQVIVVMQGEVDAQIGDRRFRLNQGESAIVPKGVAHRFVGASAEAEMLNVYSPPAY